MLKKISSKLVVRSEIPLFLKWLIFLIVIVVISLAGVISYHFGLKNAGYNFIDSQGKINSLNETIFRLNSKITELKKQISKLERKLEIEIVSQNALNDQIEKFSKNNSQLEEDLAFFDALMNAGGLPKGISIQRFDIKKDIIPEEYIFSLLVVNSKERVKIFSGRLVLNVFYKEDGVQKEKKVRRHENQDTFLLSFKFFERIDGSFKLPRASDLIKIKIEIFVKGAKVPVYSTTETYNSKE